jgi:4-hydroxy-tetrahydrodipicolinate reductase
VTTRVIQYGTGYAGIHALRAIITSPDLELAGLVVHSDEKAGRDAGEIAGLASTGVIAVQDIDEAIGIDAEVFCYMASTHGRLKVAIAELNRILSSGKNVVTTSFGALIDPPTARADVLAGLQASAERGGASILSTGIEPGFFSDYLPIVLSGCSQRIDSIRVYELAVYESGHQSDQVAFEIFCFGQPIDTLPPMVDPAGFRNWYGVIEAMARQLGVALDGIETSHELLPSPDSFDYQGRTIEEGTIAAVRFEIAGVVGGQKRIAVEHVTRTREDLAPDWPRGLAGDAYRVVIDGSPRMDVEVNFREGDDHIAGGFNITAMRAINAIPAVCAASPGVLSTFDLPPITGIGRVAVG